MTPLFQNTQKDFFKFEELEQDLATMTGKSHRVMTMRSVESSVHIFLTQSFCVFVRLEDIIHITHSFLELNKKIKSTILVCLSLQLAGLVCQDG